MVSIWVRLDKVRQHWRGNIRLWDSTLIPHLTSSPGLATLPPTLAEFMCPVLPNTWTSLSLGGSVFLHFLAIFPFLPVKAAELSD